MSKRQCRAQSGKDRVAAAIAVEKQRHSSLSLSSFVSPYSLSHVDAGDEDDSDSEENTTKAQGTSIILDNGCGVTKAGFAGESEPRASFTSVIGRPHVRAIGPRKVFQSSPSSSSSLSHKHKQTPYYIGNAAQSKKAYRHFDTQWNAV